MAQNQNTSGTPKPQAQGLDISTILAIVSGAQSIIKAAVPEIERILSKGEASVEDQAQLKGVIDSIRDGSAFGGKEWNQSAPPI